MDRQVRDSASQADHPPPLALTQAARAPNIPRAQGRVDLQVPAAQQHPVHGPDLAHAQDSARGQVSLERGRAQAAHLRPVKLHARSAPVHGAADEASSNIPRPKKAR